MKRSVLPELVYRAHANAVAPMAIPSMTGGYRSDDFRRPPKFYVLYTGGGIEGCFKDASSADQRQSGMRQLLLAVAGSRNMPAAWVSALARHRKAFPAECSRRRSLCETGAIRALPFHTVTDGASLSSRKALIP